ncbi:MAG TPA: ABC transporter ATP-binding protein, partial [Caldimonas sp.]
HDVDEAVLLSDRVVMMTNGPAATIGEVLAVPIAPVRESPRNRIEMAHHAGYLESRERVLEFLYRKQAHVEPQVA